MLLGRKHANFWRTSDCGEKHDVATLEYLMVQVIQDITCFAVCCAVAFVIYIYMQPFSVAKLNVSLFFLAGVAPGNTTGLKLERFHQRNASPTHIYTFFLFQFALCLPAGVSPGIAVASDDQLFWQEM